MQVIESIPLFRTVQPVMMIPTAKDAPESPQPPDDLTFTLADVDALAIEPSPLPPLRNRTGKPSLPVELWVKGLATFAEARQAQQRLSVEYGTALGKDGAGYFVRCPGWQW